MDYAVVVQFAFNHNASFEAQNIERYLNGNNVAYRTIGFGAWIVTAAQGATAQGVAQDIGHACLQSPDHIFVTEVTPNSFSI